MLFKSTKSVRASLLIRVALVSGVFIAALVYSMASLQHIANRFTDFIDKDDARFKAFQEMYAQGLQSGQAVRNVILVPGDAQAPKSLAASSSSFTEALQKAQVLATGDKDFAALVASVASSWKALQGPRGRILEVAATNQAEAVEIMTKEELPAWRAVRLLLLKEIEAQTNVVQSARASVLDRTKTSILLGAAFASVAVILAMTVAFWITRCVTTPLRRLGDTVKRLAANDNEARTELRTKDELGALGMAFDTMMDERVASQLKIQQENDTLNNSVLGLLQGVAQLSKRDLTVKVVVTEDVTGPVADALNLLTGETAKVLQQVSDVSADVTAASLKVKSQTEIVMSVADTERRQVEHTAESLAAAAKTMNQIAELAQTCNKAADNAISSTQTALATVTSTVGGINNTRDTIRETEKRIKRLGERSQEISGAVNLINSIAERTHILALNASMHAASAGEAGRGFAVVADEVQRLAENARQATQQIATLVTNIQVETADTVTTMNTAIGQVVEGSRLAEQAGRQMEHTQKTTAELVASVQEIAKRSQEQASISNELLKGAGEIRKSTQETSHQLREQTEQTNNLVEYAKHLLSAVRLFKLPA
jgi:methyl-accepting chemotaxis protein